MRARGDGKRPDLVDRAELAERLGVSGTTMNRWERRAILPEPDLRVGSQDVWLWETIRDWAKQRSTFRKRQNAANVPDVVDLADLASRLGISLRFAEKWRTSGLLPEPDYRWETIDGWLWDTILTWERTSAVSRHPARRRVATTPVRDRAPSGPSLSSTATTASGPGRPAEVPAAALRTDPAGPEYVDIAPPARTDPLEVMERLQERFASIASDLRPEPQTTE